MTRSPKDGERGQYEDFETIFTGPSLMPSKTENEREFQSTFNIANRGKKSQKVF